MFASCERLDARTGDRDRVDLGRHVPGECCQDRGGDLIEWHTNSLHECLRSDPAHRAVCRRSARTDGCSLDGPGQHREKADAELLRIGHFLRIVGEEPFHALGLAARGRTFHGRAARNDNDARARRKRQRECLLYEKRCFNVCIPRFRERFPVEFVDTTHAWRYARGQHYHIGLEFAEETLHERGIRRVALEGRESFSHVSLERTQLLHTARYRSHAYWEINALTVASPTPELPPMTTALLPLEMSSSLPLGVDLRFAATSAVVLIVAAPPEARLGLVAPLGGAVEPLVHAPEAVQSARIGGISVVYDAVLERERAHARPLARVGGHVGSGHGGVVADRVTGHTRRDPLVVALLPGGLAPVVVFDAFALLLLGERSAEVEVEVAADRGCPGKRPPHPALMRLQLLQRRRDTAQSMTSWLARWTTKPLNPSAIVEHVAQPAV